MKINWSACPSPLLSASCPLKASWCVHLSLSELLLPDLFFVEHSLLPSALPWLSIAGAKSHGYTFHRADRPCCTSFVHGNLCFAPCPSQVKSARSVLQFCPNGTVAYDSVAISSSDYSNLGFFEQFAAAAYCPLNNRDNAGGTKITCSAGNCPLVESNDVISVYEFEKYVLPRQTDLLSYCLAADTAKVL